LFSQKIRQFPLLIFAETHIYVVETGQYETSKQDQGMRDHKKIRSTGVKEYQYNFQDPQVMEIKKRKRKRSKLKMLRGILAHHPFYLKGLQGANLKN